MAEQRTVIQFHETYCEVFIWQADRDNYKLKTRLRVALENTPEASDSPDYLEAVQRNGITLQQALRGTGAKVRQAIAVIPKHWVTLRFAILPSDNPEELEEMARFETGRHIPFNMERHVVDYHLLSNEGLEGSRVVLAALDGPPANELTLMMNAAGIELTALEVSSIALTNALFHYALWDTEKNPTVAHIDIEQETTDITILQAGQPVFSRSVALGIERLFGTAAVEAPGTDLGVTSNAISLSQIEAVDLTLTDSKVLDLANPETADSIQPEPRAVKMWKTRFIQEIRQSYDYARRELECQPLSVIFLSGPGSRLKNITQALAEQIPGVEVIRIDPLQSDSQSPKLQVDDSLSVEQREGSSMACSIGTLLRDIDPNALRINLLPVDYIKAHAATRTRRSMITTAILSAALVVCIMLAGFQNLQAKRLELKDLETQVEENRPRVKEIRYRQTVVKILKTNSSEKKSALAILNSIGSWKKMFERRKMLIALTEFNYTENKNVKIVGHAASIHDLNIFQSNLDESGHFAEVHVASRTPVKLGPYKKEVLRFTLNCYFNERKGSKRR